MLRHEDTTLWWVQAVTGFALFFLASVHLYQMLMHPGDIGPVRIGAIASGAATGGRFIWCCCSPWSSTAAWPLPVGGQVGLVRGRGSQSDADAAQTTQVGNHGILSGARMFTLAAYMKIGHEHRDRVGERYVPSYECAGGATLVKERQLRSHLTYGSNRSKSSNRSTPTVSPRGRGGRLGGLNV